VCLRRDCATPLFPRIEPAVIALVEAPGTPGRCLLGRRRGAAPDSYALLAGFVEVGENLEDAVRREVAEEAGVELAAVTYQASQAWPFPAGLMVGFRAVAVSDAVCADDDELEEVRWFTRADMRQRAAAGPGRPPPFNADSIESWLVESWMRESDRRPRTKAGGIR
jgi:NAD+ diphosphatase